MKSFEWADATSIYQAVSLTVKGSAYKAGGVDVVDLMKERLFEPTRLVNLRTIPGLDQVSHDDKAGLKLGPLVTLSTLASHDVVRSKYQALAQSAGHAATPQIRNMATLGGNILQRPRCWYFRNEAFHCRKKGGETCFAQDGENQYHAIFDNGLCAIVHPSATACALIALGGQLEITDGKDKRHVAIEDFLTPPSVDVHRENSLKEGELITQIIVPPMAPSAKSYYIKQGEKESFDWPLAEVAVVIDRDGDLCKSSSIVLGAAAPTPLRATASEEMLKGKKIDESIARQAANAAMADATPLSNNGYKVTIFKAIIARAILAAANGKQEA
jgi:xanthine dehydrogenase YagS FAD-binding subunit